MGKNPNKDKKVRRKERARAEREEKRRLELEAQRRSIFRKRVLMILPVVGLSLAAAAYWVLDSKQTAGVVLLLSALIVLVYGLGTLGASVTPRDRGGAGSIDFGNK